MTAEPENRDLAIAEFEALLARLRDGDLAGPLRKTDYPSLDEYINLRRNGYRPWSVNYDSTPPL